MFKTFFFGLTALSLFLASRHDLGAADAPFFLRDGDRVVFYGDSITEQLLYTVFTETFVLTRFPHMKVSFVHSGWSGDRVSGGGGGNIAQRLERDVLAYKPTVMTIMLGMNDGSYRSYDEEIFQTYAQGYLSILDTVSKALPHVRFTLIAPSPYDDVTRPMGFEGGYNRVLLQYSDFIKKTAKERQQMVADFNNPVVAVLGKAFAVDPAGAQQILPDRVHPAAAGHLIMAGALLEAWNAPSDVSRVEIDAQASKVVIAQETTVTDLHVSAERVSWQQNDTRLPFPVNLNDPVITLAIKSSDFMEKLNQEILKVTGLPKKGYQLLIDGNYVGAFTAEDLAVGVNLATLPTPMRTQAEAVAALTVEHNAKHTFRWRSIQIPLENDPNPEVVKALPVILGAFDRQEEALVAQQRAAAQPVPHKYELVPATIPSTPNYALNKTWVASDPNSLWVAGLTDGVKTGAVGNVWASGQGAFPKNVTLDLVNSVSLGLVYVTVPPYGSTKTVEVSLSEDGQNFTSIGKHVFSQGEMQQFIYEFPEQTARYIRLTYLDHHDEVVTYPSDYVFTAEVEAYGTK